jgi:malate synthase
MPTKKTVKAPAKKVVAKKAAPKKSVVTKQVEKKLDEAKKQIHEEAKFVQEESKELATGVSKWWNHSSAEEKIYTILGILTLIWGLYVLRSMVGGLLLIIVGILFVTGYFVKKE